MQREIVDNTVAALVLIMLLVMGSCMFESVALAEQDDNTAPSNSKTFQFMVSHCMQSVLDTTYITGPRTDAIEEGRFSRYGEPTIAVYTGRLVSCLYTLQREGFGKLEVDEEELK
jgi:hypothetical protein